MGASGTVGRPHHLPQTRVVLPELSLTAWIVIGVALVVGAVVQGSVGFGLNVVAAPIVALVEPLLVPVPLLVAALAMSVAVALREHTALVFDELGWALVGRVPGVLLGAVAVAALAKDDLAIVLGVSVLIGVGVSLAGWHVPIRRGTLVTAGVVSGFMGTSTSVGGPPMALLYQHGEGGTVRANLNGFFAVGVVMSLTVLALTAGITTSELWLSAAVVPPTLLGFAASNWTRHHVDRGRVRPLVLLVSAVSAAALLVHTMAG